MSSNSSTEPEEIVEVEWDVKDLLAVAFGVTHVPLEIRTLRKSQILEFCAGCKMLEQNGVCRFGQHDQTRYVARQWCGWAQKDGKSGVMTEDGFKTGKTD